MKPTRSIPIIKLYFDKDLFASINLSFADRRICKIINSNREIILQTLTSAFLGLFLVHYFSEFLFLHHLAETVSEIV